MHSLNADGSFTTTNDLCGCVSGHTHIHMVEIIFRLRVCDPKFSDVISVSLFKRGGALRSHMVYRTLSVHGHYFPYHQYLLIFVCLFLS